MVIFFLKRRDRVCYDEASSMVVRAPDEHSAREIAARSAGDEGENVWLDHASCVPVEADGPPEMICRDLNAG